MQSVENSALVKKDLCAILEQCVDQWFHISLLLISDFYKMMNNVVFLLLLVDLVVLVVLSVHQLVVLFLLMRCLSQIRSGHLK